MIDQPRHFSLGAKFQQPVVKGTDTSSAKALKGAVRIRIRRARMFPGA